MPKIKKHLEDIYRVNLDGNERGSYLRLDKNEGASIPFPFVSKVIEKINPELLSMYPEYGRLKNKLAKHVNLDAENICIGNGSDAIIKNIFEAYIEPNDKVIFTDPTFAMYPIYCNIFNAKPCIIEYKSCVSFPESRFMNALYTNDVKMAVIIYPNNPTGHAASKAFLRRAIERAHDLDILMVVDEAYHFYYRKSVADLIKKYNNLIVLRTFSKFFGIASLRMGFGMACPEIIENLRKVQSTFDLNGIAALFGDRLLDAFPEATDRIYSDYSNNKCYLEDKLADSNIVFQSGEANFILIDCGDRVNDIKDKLAEKKILVGGGFKQDILKKYLRVTIGKKEHMETFWKAFIDIWGKNNDS